MHCSHALPRLNFSRISGMAGQKRRFGPEHQNSGVPNVQWLRNDIPESEICAESADGFGAVEAGGFHDDLGDRRPAADPEEIPGADPA